MDAAPEILSQQLHPEEKLLWWGQPGPVALSNTQFNVRIFSIFWTVLVCLWVYMFNNAPDDLPLARPLSVLGLPLILFGFILSTRSAITTNKMVNTFYAVTDTRLLILTSGAAITCQTCKLSEIIALHSTESEGRGDLYFVLDTSWIDQFYNLMLRRYSRDTAYNNVVHFKSIKSPRDPEKIVLDIHPRLNGAKIEQ